jgi:peptidase E
MTYLLTSSPSLSMDGAINPANGFLEQIRRLVPNPSRCVFVSSHPDEPGFGDHCTVCMAQAFENEGLRFEAFDCLDRRNADQAQKLIDRSDWIILGGGHVPTQNAFLNEINMARMLQGYKGLVMGISAGSMNCARIVYSSPEEKGEAVSPGYKRYLRGLGLTEVQILPHYYMCKDALVDGQKVYEDIAMPDSCEGHRFYVFPDGTYLLGSGGRETIYGEFFIIENGVLRKVCENGQSMELPFI